MNKVWKSLISLNPYTHVHLFGLFNTGTSENQMKDIYC